MFYLFNDRTDGARFEVGYNFIARLELVGRGDEFAVFTNEGIAAVERVARVENLHAGVETLDLEARHRHTLRCRRADCVGDVVERRKRGGNAGAGIGGDRDGVALECGAGIVE